MAPNPDRRRPPARTLLSLTDVAAVCGVSRDMAKMWDWTGQLPAPEVSVGVKKVAARGWDGDVIFRDWCEPRGMARAEFDAALRTLSLHVEQ